MFYSSRQQQAGFTLLELMTTVAIVAIVAGIAFFSAGEMLAKDRAENHLLELKRNLSFARAKASITESNVVVCPLSGSSCSTDWAANPVTIFVDADNSGGFSAGDTQLRVMDAISNSDKLTYSGTVTISFAPTGRVGANQDGTFVYCPDGADASTYRALTLTLTGSALYNGVTSTSCS